MNITIEEARLLLIHYKNQAEMFRELSHMTEEVIDLKRKLAGAESECEALSKEVQALEEAELAVKGEALET